MPLNKVEQAYWDRFAAKQDTQNHNVRAGMAGNKEMADQLLSLYLNGKKTAASGLVADYKTAGDPLPEEGSYWIILDSEKTPKCIVQTIKVAFCKFNQVTDEVAKAEGEGDLSLEYWRKAHTDFFSPFLKEWGITDLENEMVVIEFFKVVYK